MAGQFTIRALLAALGSLSALPVFAEVSVPTQVAARVDAALVAELGLAPKDIVPLADNVTLVRRLRLDTVGVPPTRTEFVSDFARLQSGDFEGQIDALLGDEAFGTNWGRYWRDVILYRRTEQRAVLASRPAEEFLASQFNANRPWSETAEAFVTATGDVYEEGSAALIFAQQGQPEETAAEVSRIFLGIQIQCAQCHDHPWDSWKREQFHELAAFFPRVAVRPTQGDGRSFEVTASDLFLPFRRMAMNNRYRGSAEHRMPDLERPEEPGETMTPTFFVTGDSLKVGTKDADRRAALSAWIASPQNEWFAKAFVNRMWAELVGRGFYEPVDDLGPERPCAAPETLAILATEFTDSGYDVKRLFKVILLTEAYRRQSQPRSMEQPGLASSTIQPLRGDQLFDAILTSLDLPEEIGPRRRGDDEMMSMRPLARSPRFAMNQAFGYDPSQPRDEVEASIPQALAMMNSPMLNLSLSAYRRQGTSSLIRTTSSNVELARELYVRTLDRLPTEREMAVVNRYVATAPDRNEAFEDLLWSLVNSTEFRHRK